MASKRKKTKPQSRKRRILIGLFKFSFWMGLLVFLGVTGYLLYLDRTITETFEGRRWSIPAQVFAQPLELHAGLPLSRPALRLELTRLGYRADASLRAPGTFQRHGDNLRIYLRAFHFMERQRRSQQIEVQFAGGQISGIRDTANRDVPLIRLDAATIGSFFPSHGEDRLILQPDDVPPLLADGLKAVEDRNFDNHVGFSIKGILRALLVNIRAGERQQGGSTLTQQLVKSYYLTNRRTIERKLQEVAMAVILEARFSKDDLLTAYINEIFLGQNGARAIHGFGLGSHFYFNKPIAELDVDEVATMISIIRGPSFYNPFRHPQRALERRDRILATFLRDGLIDQSTHDRVVRKPLGVVASATSGSAYYPAFMDLVRAELRDDYDIAALSSEGLRVFTTIKPREQENVQLAVSNTLNQIEKDRGLDAGSLQAAAIVADAQTGDVHALVGGRKGRVDGFNRALNAKRSVGSLIKPVVYLTAIESGFNLASVIKDEPITVKPKFGEPWTPKNFDGEHRGDLPLVRALAQSLNLATVHLGNEVGLENIQARFSDLIGREPANPYPSFLLGAEALTPIEMLELYGNFASNGFRTPPKSVIAVLDETGAPVTHHPFELKQTIAPGNVAAINRALEIVMAKGTGRSSPFAKDGVAGKTGTSDDNRDSWFAGFDNTRVSVVWVGRDDNAIARLTGSSGALRIWTEMTRLDGVSALQLGTSDDLVEVEWATGLRATAACADVVRVPVPDVYALPIKPGCGIKPTLRQRLRSFLGD